MSLPELLETWFVLQRWLLTALAHSHPLSAPPFSSVQGVHLVRHFREKACFAAFRIEPRNLGSQDAEKHFFLFQNELKVGPNIRAQEAIVPLSSVHMPAFLNREFCVLQLTERGWIAFTQLLCSNPFIVHPGSFNRPAVVFSLGGGMGPSRPELQFLCSASENFSSKPQSRRIA